MKVPYRPKTLARMKMHFRFVILHDVSCQFEHMTEFYKDTPKFQTGKLRAYDFILNSRSDLNYHFIVEKVNDDYESIVGRPLSSECDYPDISSPFDKSIHVCLMGNYSVETPTQRFYQQLAYRVVGPILKVFHMNFDRIKFHSEVSKDYPNCPGKLFSKDVFVSLLKSMLITK